MQTAKRRPKRAAMLLALALAALLACALFPASAFASPGSQTICLGGAGDYRGDNSGFAQAFSDVAENGTVKLTGDMTISNGITLDKSCVFDLNGHSLTMNADNNFSSTLFELTDQPHLTIQDSTGSGALNMHGTHNQWNTMIDCKAGSSLTVLGGALNMQGDRGTMIECGSDTSIDIQGGTLTSQYIVVAMSSNASLTMTGGKLLAHDDPLTTIMMSRGSSATATLSGGTVEAEGNSSAAITIELSSDRVIINGATVTSVTSADKHEGTIVYCPLWGTVPLSGNMLEVQSGTVKNTASPEGYSLYFDPIFGNVDPSNVKSVYSVTGGQLGRVFPTAAYSVEAGAGPGGSISPNGSVAVNDGESQVFAIAPNSGYEIASVMVDGQEQGAVSSFTLSNVTAGHTIVATFRNTATPGVNTILASGNAVVGGSIAPSGPIKLDDSGSQTFTITTSDSCTIEAVLVDGINIGPVDSYTFDDVAADHSIAVRFHGDVAPSPTPSPAGGGFGSSANADQVYSILEGEHGVWHAGESGLSVLVDAPYAEFYSVEVNQSSIPGNCYTAEPGSTRVTLNPDYLATLSPGTYGLRIVFNEGFAATDFTVAPATAPAPTPAPVTGDGGPLPAAAAAALLVLAGGAIGALTRRMRTR